MDIHIVIYTVRHVCLQFSFYPKLYKSTIKASQSFFKLIVTGKGLRATCEESENK